MIWVLSDTHFGDERQYKMRSFIGGPKRRPEFENATEGDRAMIERIRALVLPHDKVYHGGDVGDLRIFREAELPGKWRAILGNHDPEDPRLLFEAGFQKVFSSRKLGNLVFTHIPISLFSLDSGMKNVHGHTHEKVVMRSAPRFETECGGHYGEECEDVLRYGELPDERYINVSVERIGYQPVRLESLR